MLPQDVQHTFNSSNSSKAVQTFEEIEASIVESWFLMSNPVTFTSIMLAYLFIVLKFGPENMKSRSPYNIKYIMLAYNLFQIYLNIKIFCKIVLTPGAVNYLSEHTCHPLDIGHSLRIDLLEGVHMYLVSKVLDLVDTIFFVLKKKQSHISFLHVYHHSVMATAVWVFLKYFRGEDVVIIGFLNSFVHVVMYTYYFLAGLGPHMQKYLWWKKYLTTLQLVQFVLIVTWMVMMLCYKCSLSNYVLYLSVGNASLFFYLFMNFYIKAYCKKTSNAPSNKKTKSS